MRSTVWPATRLGCVIGADALPRRNQWEPAHHLAVDRSEVGRRGQHVLRGGHPAIDQRHTARRHHDAERRALGSQRPQQVALVGHGRRHGCGHRWRLRAGNRPAELQPGTRTRPTHAAGMAGHSPFGTQPRGPHTRCLRFVVTVTRVRPTTTQDSLPAWRSPSSPAGLSSWVAT